MTSKWLLGTYRLEVHVRKISDQLSHCFDTVIDSFQQDGLISDNDVVLEEVSCRFSCDPRYLVWMVEMSVQAHVFTHPPGFVRQTDERIGPVVARV